MATCLNRCSLVTVAGLVLGVCMTAEAKPFPKGTYAIKLGKNEEKLALKFESKGKFTLLRFGDEVASGTYQLAKGKIDFQFQKGKFIDKNARNVGTYQWKLEGKKLSFTIINDNFERRVKTLTAGPWERE